MTKKFGKGNKGGRIYHKPYVLELVVATYYLVGWCCLDTRFCYLTCLILHTGARLCTACVGVFPLSAPQQTEFDRQPLTDPLTPRTRHTRA